MNVRADEIAKLATLRLTPCWWTLGLLLPTVGGINLVASQLGAGPHPVTLLLNGTCLLLLTFSFVYWLDEWAEFNRRPRAWMVKHFPDAWPLFPGASPDKIEGHRNVVRFIAFGCGWMGALLVLGAGLKAVGIAR